MYTHYDPLLSSIKIAAAQRHLMPLLQLSRPRPHPDTPFEVYQYEERIDFDEVEARIKQEIVREMNVYLFEEERGRLEMELFGLERAVEIEQAEIEMLRMQIEAERSKVKMRQLERMAQSREREEVGRGEQSAKVVENGDGQKEVNLKDNSRLSIYPCVRVGLDPPKTPQDVAKKQIPLLPLHVHFGQKEKEHHKSHRQMLATYTKRSLASSQQNPQQHYLPRQQHAKRTIVLKEQTSLLGLQRQIAFLQRAWNKARSQGQARQCKRYKEELMTLIGHFWQATV